MSSPNENTKLKIEKDKENTSSEKESELEVIMESEDESESTPIPRGNYKNSIVFKKSSKKDGVSSFEEMSSKEYQTMSSEDKLNKMFLPYVQDYCWSCLEPFLREYKIPEKYISKESTVNKFITADACAESIAKSKTLRLTTFHNSFRMKGAEKNTSFQDWRNDVLVELRKKKNKSYRRYHKNYKKIRNEYVEKVKAAEKDKKKDIIEDFKNTINELKSSNKDYIRYQELKSSISRKWDIKVIEIMSQMLFAEAVCYYQIEVLKKEVAALEIENNELKIDGKKPPEGVTQAEAEKHNSEVGKYQSKIDDAITEIDKLKVYLDNISIKGKLKSIGNENESQNKIKDISRQSVLKNLGQFKTQLKKSRKSVSSLFDTKIKLIKTKAIAGPTHQLKNQKKMINKQKRDCNDRFNRLENEFNRRSELQEQYPDTQKNISKWIGGYKRRAGSIAAVSACVSVVGFVLSLIPGLQPIGLPIALGASLLSGGLLLSIGAINVGEMIYNGIKHGAPPTTRQILEIVGAGVVLALSTTYFLAPLAGAFAPLVKLPNQVVSYGLSPSLQLSESSKAVKKFTFKQYFKEKRKGFFESIKRNNTESEGTGITNERNNP